MSTTYTRITKGKGVQVTRKYRDDAPCMAAGVISWPRERLDEWQAYCEDCVAWLKDCYGDRLVSVVEHLDEAHPHLHFYLIPRPGEAFGTVHPGYRASREARQEEGNKVRSAFNDAMREWQSDLFNAVSARYGLQRIGPRRTRRERDAHMLEKLSDETRKAVKKARQELEDVEAHRQAVEKWAQEVARAESAARKKMAAAEATMAKAKEMMLAAKELGVKMTNGLGVIRRWMGDVASKLPSSIFAPLFDKLEQLGILGGKDAEINQKSNSSDFYPRPAPGTTTGRAPRVKPWSE